MNTNVEVPSLSLFPETAPVQVEKKGDTVSIHVPPQCEVSMVESIEGRLEISVGAGARLRRFHSVLGSTATQSFAEVQVAESGFFSSSVFLLGTAAMRSTVHVRLAGDRAECELQGLYVGTGKQKIETQTLVEHQNPYTVSRQLYKGILDGESYGSFDGLVIVQKAAQKTDAAQSNKNLLLSTKAIAKSNPELKIFANDVKCKHGSTIGQIDAAQLFYLRSRGIALLEARRLLVNAFAREMIDAVEMSSLREALQNHLHV